MLYELHLTCADQDREVDEWRVACEAIDAKPLLIDLYGNGAEPLSSQMMSAGIFDTEAGGALRASQLEQTVRNHGLGVSRRKLEVPLDKGIGVYEGGDVVYHECHVKMLVRPEDVRVMRATARRGGWAASRNRLWEDFEGYEKWYLTKRAYDVPALLAAEAFMDAWESMGGELAAMARMEMETVILDTNPELDADWC